MEKAKKSINGGVIECLKRNDKIILIGKPTLSM